MIYHTHAVADFFKSTSTELMVVSRLHDYASKLGQSDAGDGDASDETSTSSAHQIERYHTTDNSDFIIHWVGFRINRPDRLITATVNDRHTKNMCLCSLNC